MNERINKISEEAEDWCHKNLGMPTPAEWNDKLFEKFAELIVRECIDICNQAILQNQDTLSKLNEDELAEKMVIHGSINQAQKFY